MTFKQQRFQHFRRVNDMAKAAAKRSHEARVRSIERVQVMSEAVH